MRDSRYASGSDKRVVMEGEEGREKRAAESDPTLGVRLRRREGE